MHRHPPNTVTGPVGPAPSHAARPARVRAAPLAVAAAVLLIAIGIGIAAQPSASGPARSTPSSAQFMKDVPPRR